MDIDPIALQALGFEQFSWNGGVIIEWWKSIRKDGDFNMRLSVMFNEWKHIPFIVYIVTPSQRLSLRHIKTTSELLQLHHLLLER